MGTLSAYIIIIGIVMVMKITNKTRGERNNNPGNILANNTHWEGQTGQDDAGYVTFSTLNYGIRAMAKILLNYQTLHGINTITGIINRWAPPDNNPTQNYIDFVGGFMDFAPLHVFDISKHLFPLIKAIIHFENGNDEYSDNEIKASIMLAVNGF